jgi:hypothetical protein
MRTRARDEAFACVPMHVPHFYVQNKQRAIKALDRGGGDSGGVGGGRDGVVAALVTFRSSVSISSNASRLTRPKSTNSTCSASSASSRPRSASTAWAARTAARYFSTNLRATMLRLKKKERC